PEEFTPLAWASINFVGPDGTVYPDAGMATPSNAEQETSSDGQSQTQQWVFLVPEELPEGGHFVIGDFGPVEEGQWIEAVRGGTPTRCGRDDTGPRRHAVDPTDAGPAAAG